MIRHIVRRGYPYSLLLPYTFLQANASRRRRVGFHCFCSGAITSWLCQFSILRRCPYYHISRLQRDQSAHARMVIV